MSCFHLCGAANIHPSNAVNKTFLQPGEPNASTITQDNTEAVGTLSKLTEHKTERLKVVCPDRVFL